MKPGNWRFCLTYKGIQNCYLNVIGVIWMKFSFLQQGLWEFYMNYSLDTMLKLFFPLILECGGQLIDTYGSIKSPGYPGNYPPGRDCIWTIVSSPSLLITFTFGTVSLEHHDDCSKDYLEVSNPAWLPQTIAELRFSTLWLGHAQGWHVVLFLNRQLMANTY